MTGSAETSRPIPSWTIPARTAWAIASVILLLVIAALAYWLWSRVPPVEERIGAPQQGVVPADQAQRAAALARENEILQGRMAELKQQMASAACPPGTQPKPNP